MVKRPRRDEVWRVSLDPTEGSEIQKNRPCVVVSPDEANEYLRTVIIAPMTTSERSYPTRVGIIFQGRRGQVALDQIGAVDQERPVRKLGTAPPKTASCLFRTGGDVHPIAAAIGSIDQIDVPAESAFGNRKVVGFERNRESPRVGFARRPFGTISASLINR